MDIHKLKFDKIKVGGFLLLIGMFLFVGCSEKQHGGIKWQEFVIRR